MRALASHTRDGLIRGADLVRLYSLAGRGTDLAWWEEELEDQEGEVARGGGPLNL